MTFNLIDILLLVLVLLSVLGGYRRGFILGVLDLAGWVLSLLAGLRFYPPVAHWLGAYVHSLPQIWNRPIAFIFVGIVVGAAVHLLGSLILKRSPKPSISLLSDLNQMNELTFRTPLPRRARDRSWKPGCSIWLTRRESQRDCGR